MRNLCFTGESGIQELAGNGDSPSPQPSPAGRGGFCKSLRWERGQFAVRRARSAPHRGYRIESGKSIVVVAGMSVGWVWLVEGSALGPRSESGKTKSGHVGVSPSPQPSPAGRGGRVGTAPHRGAWRRERGCALLSSPNPLPEGEGVLQESPLGEGAIRGAPRPFRAPPWVPDRVRQVDCCSRGYVCRLGLVGGRECPGSPIGVGEDEKWACRRFFLTPTLSRWERGKSGYCPASGCGMTLCPRYDEGGRYDESRGRYDGISALAFHPHPNPLPEGEGVLQRSPLGEGEEWVLPRTGVREKRH